MTTVACGYRRGDARYDCLRISSLECVNRRVAPRHAHLGANPLFQVAFTVRDSAAAAIEIPGATISVLDPPDGISKFDLTMEIETNETPRRSKISPAARITAWLALAQPARRVVR